MYSSGASRLCVLALVVLTAACNSERPVTPTQTVQTARVRIVNAAPGVPNVEVVRAGVTTPLAQNLNYGAFTQSCITLPANIAHTLVFRSGGADVATTEFTPEANAEYSAFLTSSGTTRRAFVVEDDPTAATAGTNGIRVINSTTGPGDVYVTPAAAEFTPAMRIHGGLGVTAMGNHIPVYVVADTAWKHVRLYDVGATAGTPRVEFVLSGLPSTRLASVVLADVASAGPAASFVTYPCA